MLKGYKIIDADSHVIEPVEMWAKYLDPEFRQFAPSPDMKINEQFTLVYEPIVSHYEMVYQFQFNISWDTFYGVGTELFKAGFEHTILNKMTIGYPPIPSELALKQEEIANWATADDFEGDLSRKIYFICPKNKSRILS